MAQRRNQRVQGNMKGHGGLRWVQRLTEGYKDI